jgi:RNA polymerase sigma-70 factor (ECF subfamily)
MLAVAISLLGYGPDAEDAVQEASLVALRRIGDLRDPAAVGPWLRAVVRNVCRMRLRANAPIPTGDDLAALPSAEPDPAQLLERSAFQDWIWHAIDELSAPLRLVVMLRYFTAVTAYQDIAQACGVPVGTVRSRLNEARGKLAQNLLTSADAAHGGVAAVTAQRRREAEAMIGSLDGGHQASVAHDLWLPTIEVLWASGKRTKGYDYPLAAMDRDLSDGVKFRLTNVVGGCDTVIWETAMINPADDPDHCPPAAAWVQHLHHGRVERMRIMHARRPDAANVAPARDPIPA